MEEFRKILDRGYVSRRAINMGNNSAKFPTGKINRKIKILIADGEEDHFKYTKAMLESIDGTEYFFDWAVDYDIALEKINHSIYDAYIFDFQIGQNKGMDLLKETLRTGSNVPVIFLSNVINENVDNEAMSLGASIFLERQFVYPELLDRSIRYSIKQKRREDELRQLLSTEEKWDSLIPICAGCKSIRDKNGYWHPMELFFESNSNIKFSHGICKSCTDELYKNEEWHQKSL